ncbi:MAG TPA: hypothetical protein VHP35_18760, partial [Terriglobia bacterium]|nr:hypothetical protein [Terriglobia bacterium]
MSHRSSVAEVLTPSRPRCGPRFAAQDSGSHFPGRFSEEFFMLPCGATLAPYLKELRRTAMK